MHHPPRLALSAPVCSSAPPDGTNQGCDADQKSFKIYLVQFTSSKVSEKCKSVFFLGGVGGKSTLLKQLLFKHMQQKAKKRKARLTSEVWEPIFPPLASGWWPGQSPVVTPGLALPGGDRHGPNEAWAALAGAAFPQVLSKRSKRLMRGSIGGCLSCAAAARRGAGGVPYLFETAVAPWGMCAQRGLTYGLPFVTCPWEVTCISTD